MHNNFIKQLYRIVLFIAISATTVQGQIQKDPVKIREVRITRNRIFKKEEAGQKKIRVDSILLMDKIDADLSELLSENTTIYIKSHGRGALATASFRGTAPSHTQVFWNGMNINSPMLGMVDFSLIPVHIIDELTLEHGGSSIIRQSGGLGGSINLDNKPNWNNKFHVTYSQAAGSFNTWDSYAKVGSGTNNFQSTTRLYYNYSDNDYEFINKNVIELPKEKNKNADYKKYGAIQELYFRPTEKQVASVKVWGQQAERAIPTVLSYEGEEQSNMNNQQDNTVKLVADWKYYGLSSRYSFSAGYDYQKLLYTLKNIISGQGKATAIYSDSKMHTLHAQASIQHHFSERLEGEFHTNFRRYDVLTKDTVQQTGYDIARNDYSFFGGLYYNLSKEINLSLMARNDLIDNATTPLIYNLGVSYKPFAHIDLVTQASFSRNYHHPVLNDLYWQPGGNPDLKPEKGYTRELSLKYKQEGHHLFTNLQLTGYHSDIDDWIIWLPSFKGYWEPFNVKKVTSYGLEFNANLNYKVGKWKFGIHGNCALTKSINYGEKKNWGDDSYGKQLPFIPVHSGNILLSLGYKTFYARYQFSAYGERFLMSSNKSDMTDDSWQFGMTTPTQNWYYPLYRNKLTLGKKFQLKDSQILTELKVNNLFDELYRSILGRYMPGRHFVFLIKYSFDK